MTERRFDVSVVVATRDRANRLQRALAALADQDFAKPFEIVVVDDASKDSTPVVLEGLGGRVQSAPLVVVRRERPGGPGAARNSGWKRARADLIAFTDDDCEPTREWLREIVSAARPEGMIFVQGVTLPKLEERSWAGPFSRTLRDENLGPWFPTSNVMYPKKMLERLGGFDESLLRGEDTDLAWRALESGSQAVHAPAAVVHHGFVRLGPVGRLKVAWRWHAAVRNIRAHPTLRNELIGGRIWKPAHAWLLLMLLGIALAPRFKPALLLLMPYMRSLRRRIAENEIPPYLGLFLLAEDSVEVVAMLRGSIRNGILVL
jgi:glycosyltransferase involved in cell wall biosynthesis